MSDRKYIGLNAFPTTSLMLWSGYRDEAEQLRKQLKNVSEKACEQYDELCLAKLQIKALKQALEATDDN